MKYFYPHPAIPKISQETINSKEYQSAYNHCRLNSCRLRKQSARWMSLLRLAIKAQLNKPLHPALQEVVKCDNNELKQHFESLFKPGMTWDNHGEWEIDHVIPQSNAETLPQLKRLFRKHNLQPLWKHENAEKGLLLPNGTKPTPKKRVDFASHYIKQQIFSVLPHLTDADGARQASNSIKQQIFSVVPYL